MFQTEGVHRSQSLVLACVTDFTFFILASFFYGSYVDARRTEGPSFHSFSKSQYKFKIRSCVSEVCHIQSSY